MGLTDFIPVHWKLYAAGALVLASGFSGWKIRDWQCDAAQARVSRVQIERTAAANEAVDAAATTYETQRQDISHATAQDRVVIRTVFRDLAVRGDCAAPDDAVSVLDRAIERANAAAAGEPVATLPAAPAPAKAARRP